MSLVEGVRRVLRVGAWRRELDTELAFHFDRTVEDLVRAGLSPAAAREEALRRFGNEARWRREIESLDRRAASMRRWEDRWDATRYAIRHALRRLRRSPGFTIGVVLVFALGIGANTMMFSILDRVLLSPPAHVHEPTQVRRIILDQWDPNTGTSHLAETVSYPDYVAAGQTSGFADVAAVAGGRVMLQTGTEGLRPFIAERVTASIFPLLGVSPFIGRFFTPEEDRLAGGTLAAVISHGMWMREFGGDPTVLGRTLDLDAGPATVVGITPPGFSGIDLWPVDIWLPLHTLEGLSGNTYCIDTSNCTWLRLVGRLAPGVDPAAVRAEASTRLLQVRHEDVESGRLDARTRIVLTPLLAARGPLASGESRVAIWLAGISLIVILIACANVANLMLARAGRQERENGVRLALGSSRGRILGQVLVESLLLALLGGVLGALLSRWVGVALREFLLPGIAWEAPGFGFRAAGVTLILSLVAGIAAGTLPALQGRRTEVAGVLNGGGRGISVRMGRMRALLTIAQTGLSLVLLTGAGLFVLSLHRITSLDLGLDPAGVVRVAPVMDSGLTENRRIELRQRATERLLALPQVEAVSGDVATPFMGTSSTTVRPRGVDSVPGFAGGEPSWHRVDPDYFRLMRLDIRQGRALLPEDGPGAPSVAVVNETMARVYWPGERAIGQCLELGFRNSSEAEEELPCVRVVGVVENARQMGLIEDESMQFYVPAAQTPGRPGALLVRVTGREEDAAVLIRSELTALDPAMRYVEVQPLRDLVDAQTRSWRMGATLFSLFGLLALVVACVGLYSVLSYQVMQRTFEMGVRTALGARPLHLAGLVLKRAVALVGVGIVAGSVTALLVAPRLSSLLYDTSPAEPRVYISVAAVLLVVSILAAGVPALRATRSDPMAALRAE